MSSRHRARLCRQHHHSSDPEPQYLLKPIVAAANCRRLYARRVLRSANTADFASLIDLGVRGDILAVPLCHGHGSKPQGRLLELGTGTGLATACLLAGMDSVSKLVSVDNDARVQAIARDFLGSDKRVSFELADGLEFIRAQQQQSFDLVFANSWAGKYDGALALVRRGGFFIGDDLLPQANWPENHQDRADGLVAYLERLKVWTMVTLSSGPGFVIAVRS